MKKTIVSMVAAPLIMGLGVSVASATEDGLNILSDVELKGEIRPRYENADVVDNGVDAGSALTARTTLSLTAKLFEVEGLSSTIGIQTVNNFGYADYAPASTDYDVIADPQQAMLSEATIDYKAGNTALHAGRSHINLDNQRFIGTVGWRQSERSYDTLYVANSDVENLDLLAAYVYGCAGVGSTTTTDTASALLHAKYKLMDAVTLTGYGYLLASKSDTYGVALTGNIDAGAKLNYRLEYAMQADPSLEYEEANVKADANYINADLGANISGILLGINYEALSGTNGTDGKTAFATPLGTNHKFNGWADQFLKTPSGGLQDANVRIGYKAKGFGKLLGVYHMFTSAEDMGTTTGVGTDLGSEFDAVYVNSIPGVTGLKGLFKAAFYQKGDIINYQNDVTKFWAQLDYKF